MSLEDLVVEKKIYRVEIERVLHITEDPLGNYRAKSVKDIEHALTDGQQSHTVYVRMGSGCKWNELRSDINTRKPRKRYHKKKG